MAPLTKHASGVAETSSPGPTWTPKQFFEFLEGYVGEFECGQIKDFLQEHGLVIVPREPTLNMISAWYCYKSGRHFAHEPAPTDTSDYGAYRAMIAARPGEDASAAPTDGFLPSSLNQSNFSKHTG